MCRVLKYKNKIQEILKCKRNELSRSEKEVKIEEETEVGIDNFKTLNEIIQEVEEIKVNKYLILGVSIYLLTAIVTNCTFGLPRENSWVVIIYILVFAALGFINMIAILRYKHMFKKIKENFNKFILPKSLVSKNEEDYLEEIFEISGFGNQVSPGYFMMALVCFVGPALTTILFANGKYAEGISFFVAVIAIVWANVFSAYLSYMGKYVEVSNRVEEFENTKRKEEHLKSEFEILKQKIVDLNIDERQCNVVEKLVEISNRLDNIELKQQTTRKRYKKQ